jgi:sugar phosphate isomerase/epimerase
MDVTPPEMVCIAAATGYQGVSLAAGKTFLSPEMNTDLPIHSVIDNVALRHETMKRAADTGVRLDLMEDIVLSPVLDRVKCRMALDVMEEMGITRAATFDADPDRTRASECLAALCEDATARGMGVCIEFHSRSHLKSAAAAAQLISRGHYPGLKILVDALHLARAGETPEDLAKIAPNTIDSAQFCDAPAVSPNSKAYQYEAMFERQVPGEGELPLKALLKTIPKEAIIYLEVPLRGAREQGVSAEQRARRVISGMRRIEANV